MPTIDLEYHGDRAVAPGLLDLAVNVRTERPPAWLAEPIAEACRRLAAYPDPSAATRAVAAFHGRSEDEVLLTSGAADAFGLIARATAPGVDGGSQRAVVIHPQFTEPERAMRIAGHAVHRHILGPADDFQFDPVAIPADTDLVVLGNPTNPTGVLHPAATILSMASAGRTLVVDEAFMDAVPEEPEGVAARGDVPGLVVVRSLTKTWGLAGLRIGYVLAPAPMIAALRVHQTPWSVSTPALAAAVACVSDEARAEAVRRASTVERQRELLRVALHAHGLVCVPRSRGPFLLVRAPGRRSVVGELRAMGIAVRRCDTFPGLGSDWFRVAVRGDAERAALLAALPAAAPVTGS